MSELILESYKIEYETTEITIEELCTKYQITKADLTGHETWAKDAILEPATAKSKPKPPATKPPEDTEVVEDEGEMLVTLITGIKKDMLNRIKTFMADEAHYAETKEFKDMVTALKSIEDSLKDHKPKDNNTVVVIQNIIKQYEDDC